MATSRLKSEKVTESDFFIKSASYPETVKTEKRIFSELKFLVELTRSLENQEVLHGPSAHGCMFL